MIAAMSAALPGTALAAETSQEQQISVTLTAEPEYTVTIPASVSMGNEGTMAARTKETSVAEVVNTSEMLSFDDASIIVLSVALPSVS